MYSMDEGLQIAQIAAFDIEAWLKDKPETLDVKNVENDPNFQQIDVDLIWTNSTGEFKLEIKGDRWHKSRNFFFETISNKEKNTPGCFLYTQADYLFYYFIEPRTLYILPMTATRRWFNACQNRFRERETHTSVGNSSYTTVGRLVPIAVVRLEVPGVKQHQL